MPGHPWATGLSPGEAQGYSARRSKARMPHWRTLSQPLYFPPHARPKRGDEPRWRNWQTHYLEVVAPARAWRFKSSPGHSVAERERAGGVRVEPGAALTRGRNAAASNRYLRGSQGPWP